MNDLIRTFMVVALLNVRTVMAQTVSSTAAPAAPVTTSERTTGMATTKGMAEARFAAPIGHRQPRARDVGAGETAIVERIDDENAALDRKLRICRGC